MTTIVHARPVQHTTAVVQANGITTKMEVYGFYEVGDHLHLMATPSVPDDVVRFAPSAVNTTVSLYYTN